MSDTNKLLLLCTGESVPDAKNLFLVFDRCLFQHSHEEAYQERANSCVRAGLQLKGCDTMLCSIRQNQWS